MLALRPQETHCRTVSWPVSSGVQLSGNEMLNKKVLSSRRKVRIDEAVRRETGRVFHARAAATGNTRSPRLDCLVAGTNKVDVEPDLRRRHASMSDVKCSVSARYGGPLLAGVKAGRVHLCRVAGNTA